MPSRSYATRRVLLVDDHAASLLAVRSYLSTVRTWHVDTARTEQEAVALAAAHPFDAALVDLCLDDATPESGLRVARAVRELRPRAAIVVLSGHAPSPEVLARVRAVADTFLGKTVPLRTVELALAGETTS